MRGSGGKWDIRKINNYELYNKIEFSVPVGSVGDCYDRYLIRLQEMSESAKIIEKSTSLLKKLDGTSNINIIPLDSKNFPQFKTLTKYKMEYLINHFKFFSEGTVYEPCELYYCTEAPKGEFGVYLCLNNSSKPYRCKIKAPGFLHLQGLDLMSRNHMLADLVTIIGTQDIVFGEVDR